MTRVVFDLDGTLIDSVPDLARAANLLLEEYGRRPLSVERIREFIGEGMPMLAKRLAKARDLEFDDALVERFREVYKADPLVLTKPYPGVAHALASLAGSGFALSICTNKPEAPTRDILVRLGWEKYFDTIIGGDTLPQRKPDAAPLIAAMNGTAIAEGHFVGDSEVDGETAQSSGVRFLLFTEGYRKGPVESIPHQARFRRYSDLMALIH